MHNKQLTGMTFEEFKTYTISLVEQHTVRCSQLARLREAGSWSDLLTLVKQNAAWCYAELGLKEFKKGLRLVPDEQLLENGIYLNKHEVVQREGQALFINSSSEHYGTSLSEHYGSCVSKHYFNTTSCHYGLSVSEHYCNSRSEHYDGTRSEHYEYSSSEHYGSASSVHHDSARSTHYDSCYSEHYGCSTSEHYGSSASEHYGSSASYHYGSTTSRHYGSTVSSHYDDSHATHYEGTCYGCVHQLPDEVSIRDKAVVRERKTANVIVNGQ